LVAQRTPYDLSVLLPSAAEVSPDAVLTEDVPDSEWGGIAGYSRTWEHRAGLLAIGSSTTMFVETSATVHPTEAEARSVVTLFRGMDTESLAELFGLGMTQAVGGSLDSLSARRIDPPDVGAGAVAFVIFMDLGFMTMDMHMLAFTRGPYGGVVAAAGPPGQVHLSDLVPLANLMDQRMRETAVDDLPLLAEAAAVATAKPAEPSPDLAAARGLGVDLEILLTRVDGLSQGVWLSEERAERPLDGVAELSRSFEATGMFSLGGSTLMTLDASLRLHDTPASALLEVLMAEIDLPSCLDQGAVEAFGEDAVTVEMVQVPGLTVPTAAAHAQIRADFFSADAMSLVFAHGSLSGRLLLAGEAEGVSVTDAVSLAGRMLGRIGDLVPSRRMVPYTTEDSGSVAALVDVERRFRAGEVDGALRDARAIEGAATRLAKTWDTACRWGALWNRASDVLGECDRAAALSGEHPLVLNSRGIARALTGDTAGAIEDLEAYAAWTEDEDLAAKRREWVGQLRNGGQPLTDETLAQLRGACWAR
jgi:hypothetical protein